MGTGAGRRAAGQLVALATLLAAGAASAGELWTEDARQAMARAAAEEKDLLIDFTGSDWCGWCKKLDEAIALADQALQKLGTSGQATQEVCYAKYLAYARKKDKAAAKQALEAALQAAPNGTRAAQIRQILGRAFKE